MASFDSKIILERLQDGEYHPFYKSVLETLRGSKPRRTAKIARDLSKYRNWCDARKRPEPISQPLQVSGQAAGEELLRLLAEHGDTNARAIWRAARQIKGSEPPEHLTIQTLFLLGVIYIREECQERLINLKELRILIEKDRRSRISDRQWNSCLEIDVLDQALKFSG
jgi:hypothetical protein